MLYSRAIFANGLSERSRLDSVAPRVNVSKDGADTLTLTAFGFDFEVWKVLELTIHKNKKARHKLTGYAVNSVTSDVRSRSLGIH